MSIKLTKHELRLAYKLREASEILGVPVSTLRKRIKEGRIDVVTGLGPWLITKEEIDRVLSEALRGGKGGPK
ncbi:MAG: helix-turn-helix domain-containing protein [Akkermansiaceae bacterium]